MDTIECIKSYINVINYNSFTKAALVEGVTKSFISKKVSYLEKYLGVQLINRSTRSIKITSKGVEFYDYCVKIIDLVHESESAIKKNDKDVDLLRVGVSYDVYISDIYIRNVIKNFIESNKKIDISIRYINRMCYKDEIGEFDLFLLLTDKNEFSEKNYCIAEFELCVFRKVNEVGCEKLLVPRVLGMEIINSIDKNLYKNIHYVDDSYIIKNLIATCRVKGVLLNIHKSDNMICDGVINDHKLYLQAICPSNKFTSKKVNTFIDFARNFYQTRFNF
ncbi:LysR family transcriptional regulator [Zooshikella sp. RANM57]|uniref:LysR family transcriptional regulator n=1 Tax=Zooshikella sp. RANM57 TaxID=3425863 RepID=UPI003D6DAA0A